MSADTTTTTPAPSAPATPPPAAPATPEPTPAPQAAWTDALDPDLRQEPTLARYKTLNDLARGHLETKRLVGQKGLLQPKPEDPPEAWAEFHRALGVPEKPDQYNLEGFEPPPGWDPAFQGAALETFHKAGIPDRSARAVLDWYAGKVKEAQAMQAQQDQAAIETWAAQVRQRWGSAVDQKLDLATRTFSTLFQKDVAAAIANARIEGGGTLGDHPAFLEAMAQMGEKLAEHQLLGDKQPTRFARTPDEAKSEIRRLQYDKEFRDAYTNPRHPNHEQAKDRFTRLHEQAYGTASAENTITV